MLKRLIVLAVVLTAASLANTVHAGFYVGASFLQTDSEFNTAVDNFEADDSSFKVFAGFNIIKFVGIEVSYRDLGNHSDSSGGNSVDADLSAIDAEVRGILPLGKVVSIFGKIGYANISSDGNFDLSGMIDDFDEDEWDLMYGVGVDIHILKWLGVRAEWEEYDVDDSLNSLSAGAFFRF